jgi:hypothetical protein
MSEYDDMKIDVPDGSESQDPGGMDEGGEMTDDKLGLALKKAMNSSNGAAICEMVRKILDAG